MPIHQLKLIAKHEIAESTMRFDFEKPDGFNFTPGQYGGFTLINPIENDERGITRRFSIVSCPDDHVLSIAMRIQRSAFKRCLKELPIGSEIKFAGPTGIFTLHKENAIPGVFIAGGIGITPFYSMIHHINRYEPQRKITLFYGNQSLKEAAFIAELKKIENNNPNFKMIATMVDATEWQGESGFITYQLIKKHIHDLAAPIFYVCGSPAMVNALHETLNELGIQEDKIKIEDFVGY